MSSSAAPAGDSVSSVISSVQETVACAIDASIRPHLTQLQLDVDASNVLREMLLRLPEHQTLLTENRRLRRRLGEATPTDGVVLEVHDSGGRDPAWSSTGNATCVAEVDVEDLYMHEAVDTASDVGECEVGITTLSLEGDTEDEASGDEDIVDDEEEAAATAELAGEEEGAGSATDELAGEEEDDDEEEEDYYSVTIPRPEGDREFFTNDASSGEICEITAEGDIGDTVGRFVGGRAVFD